MPSYGQSGRMVQNASLISSNWRRLSPAAWVANTSFLLNPAKLFFVRKKICSGWAGLTMKMNKKLFLKMSKSCRSILISSHERFRWMESFIETVHSIAAQSALRGALRQKKPFRSFKDALMEYPAVRQQWFQFEAARVKREAIALIESFDWEILEVIDNRPA